MKPYYAEGSVEMFHGDCLDVLSTFEAERFATVITDPPYHLTAGKRGGSGVASMNENSPAVRSRIGTGAGGGGFMRKAWDGGDIAFRPETWATVMRVCKPGAMLLAFGGTRTFHRLTCAIEDAGWEIRDCITWLYGSGFPKSLDISKAIDKAAGAEREVIGSKGLNKFNGTRAEMNHGKYGKDYRSFDEADALTAPATDAAKLWNGWGTALKPAWEPIIVAMKPLDGTFAENALCHGVAGLNIDGARIGNGEGGKRDGEASADRRYANRGGTNFAAVPGPRGGAAAGRWPANVMLDKDAAALLDASVGELESGKPAGIKAGGKLNVYSKFAGGIPVTGYGDRGGASRFFYTAKASRAERGAGNTHPTVKPVALLKYLCVLTAMPDGGEILDPFGGSMTTLVAAREACRPAVAIELSEEHCQIGVERLRQGYLFGGEKTEGEKASGGSGAVGVKEYPRTFNGDPEGRVVSAEGGGE